VKDSEIGQSIVKSVRLAVNKINNSTIEIIPKDTRSDPTKALQSAKELSEFRS
jgi:ABC-type branched-subunit amino acid transport system substrate-binding protein